MGGSPAQCHCLCDNCFAGFWDRKNRRAIGRDWRGFYLCHLSACLCRRKHSNHRYIADALGSPRRFRLCGMVEQAPANTLESLDVERLWIGLLDQGPPGLLPTIPMLGWLLAQKHPRALRRFFHPLGIALFCVIGFGWYLQMVIADPSRWDYFIGNEVIGRIFTGVHRRNSEFLGAFYVYLPIIILGPLPWTVPWLIKIWNLRHAACRRLVWQRLRQAEPWTKFLLLWAMIPLVIFFLAKSRLPLYILPLFVPLSLLLAIGSQTRVNRILGHPARMAMLVAFCVLARGAISYPSLHKDSRRIADQLRPLLPSTTSEIVFVDCTAYYGLRFYLGNEVELVQFKPKMPDVELLNDELKRVEPNTAFIVEDKRVKKFLDTAKAREKFVKPIGNYEDLQLFFHPSISKSLNLPQMQTGR